jgi:hypothetical protein
VDSEKTKRGGQGSGGAERPPVDIQALSDRVYRLMLADLRLDVARAGRGPRKG